MILLRSYPLGRFNDWMPDITVTAIISVNVTAANQSPHGRDT